MTDIAQLDFGVAGMEGQACIWCGDKFEPSRVDGETCSKACRQARQRFRVSPMADQTGAALRFAFVDPPYPGLSERYYGDHPAFDGEVDHAELIAKLVIEYPDGWALCTNAPSLQMLLNICPEGTRVAIWVKGSRAGECWRARNAYEPVLIYKGRARKMTVDEVLDDVLIWGGRQHSHPGALVGMKPAPFCEWVFRQLGAAAGDELVDIFPGSGAVGRAWDLYSAAPRPGSRAARKRRKVGSRLSEASRRTSDVATDVVEKP